MLKKEKKLQRKKLSAFKNIKELLKRILAYIVLKKLISIIELVLL
ncbi:hypothetical protein NEF87_002685 [Candidatus Lokiarchaeum ossiferum]|uniref:Uncharacterized protein n=1 Tax=Candidatus Lokiarchaeum ossiferum TaxID=2951803 RepID=A0ABY6HSK1_9ARCH|nr:hypothetical protein NEF87_002685 [Candidatus Lokiarchaeum sp. B-35]